MKRVAVIGIIIGVIAALTCAATPAYADDATYCALYEGVSVYAACDRSSEVIVTLTLNQEVTVSATETVGSVTFYKVSVGDIVGYSEATKMYKKYNASSYTVALARATRTAESEAIIVYSLPRDDSETVTVLSDGTVLDVVSQYDDYFYVVQVDGANCYVKAENVTTGLTYYQTIAVVVGAVTLAAIAAIILIQNFTRKSSRTKRG